MDVGIRAAKDQRAQERIIAGALLIAERFGIDPALAEAVRKAQGRDVAVVAMKQREAIADLIDAIVVLTEPTPAAAEDGDDASTD